jgi:hypothetical protein
MHRTPQHGSSGWAAAKQDAKRRGRSHALLREYDSLSPGKGESGCLFDEISNLVEPIERSAKGEQYRGERRYTDVSAGP